MFTETIQWHELPQDGLPDCETTVLVLLEGDPEVTIGFHDGTDWRCAESILCFADPVLRWAHVPGGERNSHDERQQEQGDARKHDPLPGALAAAGGPEREALAGLFHDMMIARSHSYLLKNHLPKTREDAVGAVLELATFAGAVIESGTEATVVELQLCGDIAMQTLNLFGIACEDRPPGYVRDLIEQNLKGGAR